jgi:hypothetical protein
MDADTFDLQLSYEAISPDFLRTLQVSYEASPEDMSRQFQYALALSRSDLPSLRAKAKQIFARILESREPGATIYFRDCHFYLARLEYQDANYSLARLRTQDLLIGFPDNPQIIQLHRAVSQRHREQEKRSSEEQSTLLTIGVGVAAAVAVLAFSFVGGKKK